MAVNFSKKNISRSAKENAEEDTYMRLTKNFFLRTLFSALRLRLPNANLKHEGWSSNLSKDMFFFSSQKEQKSETVSFFNFKTRLLSKISFS